MRIDELNGKTRIFGVRINTHDHNLEVPQFFRHENVRTPVNKG